MSQFYDRVVDVGGPSLERFYRLLQEELNKVFAMQVPDAVVARWEEYFRSVYDTAGKMNDIFSFIFKDIWPTTNPTADAGADPLDDLVDWIHALFRAAATATIAGTTQRPWLGGRIQVISKFHFEDLVSPFAELGYHIGIAGTDEWPAFLKESFYIIPDDARAGRAMANAVWRWMNLLCPVVRDIDDLPRAGRTDDTKERKKTRDEWANVTEQPSLRDRIVFELVLVDLARFGFAPTFSTPQNCLLIGNGTITPEDTGEFKTELADLVPGDLKVAQSVPQWQSMFFVHGRAVAKAQRKQRMETLTGSGYTAATAAAIATWISQDYTDEVIHRQNRDLVNIVQTASSPQLDGLTRDGHFGPIDFLKGGVLWSSVAIGAIDNYLRHNVMVEFAEYYLEFYQTMGTHSCFRYREILLKAASLVAIVHAKAPSRIHFEGAVLARQLLSERHQTAARDATTAAEQRRGFERAYVEFVANQKESAEVVSRAPRCAAVSQFGSSMYVCGRIVTAEESTYEHAAALVKKVLYHVDVRSKWTPVRERTPSANNANNVVVSVHDAVIQIEIDAFALDNQKVDVLVDKLRDYSGDTAERAGAPPAEFPVVDQMLFVRATWWVADQECSHPTLPSRMTREQLLPDGTGGGDDMFAPLDAVAESYGCLLYDTPIENRDEHAQRDHMKGYFSKHLQFEGALFTGSEYYGLHGVVDAFWQWSMNHRWTQIIQPSSFVGNTRRDLAERSDLADYVIGSEAGVRIPMQFPLHAETSRFLISDDKADFSGFMRRRTLDGLTRYFQWHLTQASCMRTLALHERRQSFLVGVVERERATRRSLMVLPKSMTRPFPDVTPGVVADADVKRFLTISDDSGVYRHDEFTMYAGVALIGFRNASETAKEKGRSPVDDAVYRAARDLAIIGVHAEKSAELARLMYLAAQIATTRAMGRRRVVLGRAVARSKDVAKKLVGLVSGISNDFLTKHNRLSDALLSYAGMVNAGISTPNANHTTTRVKARFLEALGAARSIRDGCRQGQLSVFLTLVASVYNARKTYGNDPLATLANHAIDMVQKSRSPALGLNDTQLDTFFNSSRVWLNDSAVYAAEVAKANRAALLCAATASFSHQYPDEPGGGNVKTAQLSIARQFDVADGFRQPPIGSRLRRFRYLPSADAYVEDGTNAEDLHIGRDDDVLKQPDGGGAMGVFDKDNPEDTFTVSHGQIRDRKKRDLAEEQGNSDHDNDF